MLHLQQTNDAPQQRLDRWGPNPKNWADESFVSGEMLENCSIPAFAKRALWFLDDYDSIKKKIESLSQTQRKVSIL